MTRTRDATRRDREAADWFARLSSNTISMTDLDAFKQWRSDPACRRSYEKVEDAWRATGRLAGDPDIQADLAAVPDRPRARPRRRVPRSWIMGGLAAVAAGALSLGFVVVSPQRYETGVGERRLIRLADGSALQLDTNSQVEVKLGSGSRTVQLRRGQILVDVAHDASRPFKVDAGPTSVVALGTRFDVRRDGGAVRVTLLQGKVEVTDDRQTSRRWRLAPGEQIAVAAGNPAANGAQRAEPTRVDIAAVSSWTEGRLLFDSTPLAVAVAEVNRYADPPVVLAAHDLSGRPLSGAFDTLDAPAFADAVAQIYGLETVVRSDGALVLTRVAK